MRFDWYQATIPDHPVLIIETLKAQLAPQGDIRDGRGRHNYHQSFLLNDASGDRVALLLCGGPNGDPNITVSGEVSENASQIIRDLWPVHRVTRVDAAEDFAQVGGFDTLESVCREVVKEHGIKGRAIVPDDIEDGRTYYMGAPTSDVRARLYDKGAELRAKLPLHMHSQVPKDYARLEVQVRPRKDWRVAAAKMTPAQMWGFTEWSVDLARRAFTLEIERHMARVRGETSFERTHRFFLMQYGPHLRRLFEDAGSWDLVGRNLGLDLEKIG